MLFQSLLQAAGSGKRSTDGKKILSTFSQLELKIQDDFQGSKAPHPLAMTPAHLIPGFQIFTLKDVVHDSENRMRGGGSDDNSEK